MRQSSSEIERLYYGRHRLVFRIGTYLALIRMMGIAHLVTALYGHTKLVSETYARLVRTRQTLQDLICNSFESPAGCKAIQRLRDVHRHLEVSAQDYRYVLATFLLEPLRWSEHGSKKLTQDEVNLLLGFWTRVGQAMSVPDLPSSLSEWKESQRDYEAHHLRFTTKGQRLASMCLREVVRLSLPIGTRWIFRQMMIATIDPAVRESLGIADLRWYAKVPVQILLHAMR